MSAPRASKIDAVRRQHEVVRLQLETAAMQRTLKKVVAKYDAVETNSQRRRPAREFQGESGIYDMSRRLTGCALGRDLERNYSPAKALLHQFRVNVVGSQGKLQVLLPDDGGVEASAFFNEVWAKDCGYRDGEDWSTILGNELVSMIRDGDCLQVVDDDITPDDSGKLLMWEADQIAPCSDGVLASFIKEPGATQDNGIIRNKYGRVLGYLTAGKRGTTLIEKADDATFYPVEIARLLTNPYRLNQGRGVPTLITPSTNFIDLYEILCSELQTAKKASKQYGFVKRSNAVTDFDNPAGGAAWLPENDGRTAADVATDGANASTRTGARNYESLEALTGGLTDYLDAEDEVTIPDITRPNANLAAFMEAVNGMGGAALGVARAYTILRADSSYTSFRGDMLLTWTTYYWLQKMLERRSCDWTAIRVLNWAQRKKHIKPMAAGWERKLSWNWPTMPEVNELDAQNAIAQALKNGTTDYSKLLGPNWRQIMAALAEQLNAGRDLKLPLSVYELKSGGAAEIGNEKKKEVAV